MDFLVNVIWITINNNGFIKTNSRTKINNYFY